MKNLFLLAALFFVIQIKGQIPWKWQSQLPSSYDYNDMQMFGNDTILAVGLTGSFVRSTDGGMSWKFVWTKTLYNLTSLDFPDYNTGYGCGDGNEYSFSPGIVIKTTDGGDTWDSLPIPFNANFTVLDFVNPDTGWVAGDSGHVYRTTDGGTTWSDKSFGGVEMIRCMHMITPDTGFVAGDEGMIYRTFNGGASWQPCSSFSTNKINDIFFLDGKTGWFCTDNEYIFKTTNSGDTWIVQLNGGGTSPIGSVFFTDSLHGHAISTAFLYHTNDGGQVWHTENNTYHLNSLIEFGDTLHGFAAGRYGNFQKTTDGGINWTDITAPSNFKSYNEIQFTDYNTGYCVGDYGEMKKTINAGATWISLTSPAATDLHDLHFINSQIGYIAGNTGSVFKTINGGANFTSTGPGGFDDLYAVYFVNQDTGWVCGANSALFKTVNGGNSWVPETLPAFTYGAYDIVFTDPLTGYIGSWPNVIFKTTDGGTTWNALPTVIGPTTIRKIQFLSPDTGWATAENGYLIKTVDAGSTWTVENLFCFARAKGLHFFDSMNGFAAGGIQNFNCKLYRTRDGGVSWQNTDLPFGYDALSVWMTDTNRVYVTGDYGSILLCGDTSNNFSTGIFVSFKNQNTIYCYPNPATDRLTIGNNLLSKAANYFIYNLVGEQITVYESKTNVIDITLLPPGMYFIRFDNYSGRFVKE